MKLSSLNKSFNEAADRVVEFFSSDYASVSDKSEYLSVIGEDYSESPALFSACIAKMVKSSNRELYLSVFPLVEYN